MYLPNLQNLRSYTPIPSKKSEEPEILGRGVKGPWLGTTLCKISIVQQTSAYSLCRSSKTKSTILPVLKVHSLEKTNIIASIGLRVTQREISRALARYAVSRKLMNYRLGPPLVVLPRGNQFMKE